MATEVEALTAHLSAAAPHSEITEAAVLRLLIQISLDGIADGILTTQDLVDLIQEHLT